MFLLTSEQRLQQACNGSHGSRLPIDQPSPSAGLSRWRQLFEALAKHDPATACHSLRVRQYAELLADALGLDDRQCRQLILAAILHDLGKLLIPPAILRKAQELTADEYRQVQEHAIAGERLSSTTLRTRPGGQEILAAIRGHHEHFDGTGYPDGLEGAQIAVLARILAIVDSFDAMTTTRSYRAELPQDEALARLRQAAGSQFDPELVEVFIEAVQEHPCQTRATLLSNHLRCGQCPPKTSVGKAHPTCRR